MMGSWPSVRAAASAAALALLLVWLLPARAELNPRFDYVLYCAGCHLENGAGAPPDVPDLRQDMDVLVGLPAGRSYLARVPGSADAPISDAQLAGVLNWMLATFYPEQRFRPYTAREIKSYRGKPLLDPVKLRAELIDQARSTSSPSRTMKSQIAESP
jgi:mono/diheme cytochrome c family protein